MNDFPTVAYRERADLTAYTRTNAALLAHPKVLEEADAPFSKNYLYWTIGELAMNLATIGEDEAAESLTEVLLDEVQADTDGRLRAWSSLAEKGAPVAATHLRSVMGLSLDEHGNTMLPPEADLDDGRTFLPLLSLYTMGDNSVLPLLHRGIESMSEDRAEVGVRMAVKIYQAGDTTGYERIRSSALRARDYALSQVLAESELKADDASMFSSLVQGIARALTPDRSEIERHYSQADIALKYFALDLMKQGDAERATDIQDLMLSKFDSAWVSAHRFELGLDEDGKHQQAANEFLTIYGQDSGSHVMEITDALVRGGDPNWRAEYEFVFDSALDSAEIDTLLASKVLVALHLAGDDRAHHRLLELISDPEETWLLISSLEKMGLKAEATRIAARDFALDPTYSTALTLLNLQYDRSAMEVLQNSASRYDMTMLEVIHSRSRHLGKLAAQIVELEQPSE